jgi:ubiquinone/menaquinone biosynthesis C-methylase UbiE
MSSNLQDIYLQKLRKSLLFYYGEQLGLNDLENRIQSRISRERGRSTIQELSELVPIENKTLLDVGSGWGEFAFEAAQKGAIVYGMEPDREALEISVLLLDKRGAFVRASAETIPFRDETFDIVICNAVIEHVKNVKTSLNEMIRVLKPGGYLYLRAPNYLFPYEGHYKIAWLPFLPKPLAKIYLSLCGRKSRFAQSINYNSNYFYLARQLRRNDVVVRDLIIERCRHYLRGQNYIKRLIMTSPVSAYMRRSVELLIEKI